MPVTWCLSITVPSRRVTVSRSRSVMEPEEQLERRRSRLPLHRVSHRPAMAEVLAILEAPEARVQGLVKAQTQDLVQSPHLVAAMELFLLHWSWYQWRMVRWDRVK